MLGWSPQEFPSEGIMKLESTMKKLAKSAAPAGLSDYDFSGTWRNDLGSTMELDVQSGLANGTYSGPASGAGAPITGKIKGFAKADILALVIRWNIPSPSMTTWVGQAERKGGDRLRALWHLAHETPDQDEPRELWTSILSGTDLFRRG
jgi:Avidin family